MHKTTESGLKLVSVYSSISATLGNPGQANYAAANAAMEGMVEELQDSGLQASAQGWGPWGSGGMAVNQATLLARLKHQGESPILLHPFFPALLMMTMPRQVNLPLACLTDVIGCLACVLGC